jgi:hypothetical protein
VRPDVVAVLPPVGQHEPDMRHRGEQRLVEAFVAQIAMICSSLNLLRFILVRLLRVGL